MVDDLTSVKKLSAKERIEKLKELRIKREKEIKEAEKLIAESEEEAREEDKKKSLVDEQEEKDLTDIIVPAHDDLEASIQDQPIPEPVLQEMQQNYVRQMAQRATYDLYTEMQDIIGQDGLSYDQVQNLSNIQYALEQKQKDIEAGTYAASQQIRDQIDSTRKVIDELMGKYKI